MMLRSEWMLGAAAAAALIAGCSLEPKKGPSLVLRIEPESETKTLFDLGNRANPIQVMAAPSTINGFTCLAVNVTGPGITDSSIHNPETDLAGIYNRLVAGERCSYRGVIAGPFYKDTATNAFATVDASMSIPAGAGRMIQVLGVTDTTACSSGFQEDSAGGGQNYYEVARVHLPSVFSSQSVSLSTNWNNLSTAQQDANAVDCGGGCYPASTYSTGGTSWSITTGGTNSKFGFRFTVPAGGLYVKGFKFHGSTATSAQIGVSIYPDTGAGDPDTGASALAGTTVTGITATPTLHSASFGAGNGVFISAGAATSYWVVLESATAAVDISYDSGGTVDGNTFRYFGSTVFQPFTSGRPVHHLEVCN